MTGVQTCALPICFPVTIVEVVFEGDVGYFVDAVDLAEEIQNCIDSFHYSTLLRIKKVSQGDMMIPHCKGEFDEKVKSILS